MSKVSNALDSIVIFLINRIPEERLNKFVKHAQLIEFNKGVRDLARDAISVVNSYVNDASIPPYAELYKKTGLSDRVILGLYRSYRKIIPANDTQNPLYQSKA